VPQGETDLVNAVVADYNAGDMACNASGLCSDPLTIFTYSHSSAIADLAEQQLADDKIPPMLYVSSTSATTPSASPATCTRPRCTTQRRLLGAAAP
jgi:hypothetical protein